MLTINRSPKILYILGAGASAQALPLAKSQWANSNGPSSPKEVPLIKGLSFELEHFLDKAKDHFGENPRVNSIREGCIKLVNQARPFPDIDTFAKYLYLQGRNKDFEELKTLLAQYFTIKQFVFAANDSRYLSWLVGIMKKRMFPESIKVLSWNYDSQLQVAAEEFGPIESIEFRGAGYGYQPAMVSCYPSLDPYNSYSDLSVVHLNGRAGFIDLQTGTPDSVWQKRAETTIEQMIDRIFERDVHSAIHFAWEQSPYHRRLMDKVERIVEGTNIIVVVGYSFPFYNREVDKEIFKKIKAADTLHKIYFQDPKLDGQQLYTQFGLERNKIEIVHIPWADNFHIPFEY